MMEKYIIKNVQRDFKGLENFIAKSEHSNNTTLPSHLYSPENYNVKLKQNTFLASIFVSAMAGATPDFSKVNFNSPTASNTLEAYCNFVDIPFHLSIQEYKYIFESTFSLDQFINQVLSFKGLQNNWDGYGAVPTEIRCASQAISLANKLSDKIISKVSEIFPNPNGTVTIEWENHSGERLVVEVGSLTFSYYLKLNSLAPRFYNNIPVSKEGVFGLSANIKKLFI